MPYKVKLTYFKPNGKYYGEGEYKSCNISDHMYGIWAEVESMAEDKRLPGLKKGHSKFIVLVDVPDHPHNHPYLTIPRNK